MGTLANCNLCMNGMFWLFFFLILSCFDHIFCFILPPLSLLFVSLHLSLSLSPSFPPLPPSLPLPPPSLPPSPFLPQTIQDDYEKLLTREINVQFLQVLAPGVVHPNRSSNKTGSVTNVYPSAGTPSGDKSLADGVGINKRFKMEDLGLVWETVESLHHFLYPGT